jgi:uncharacterized oligopeptide transporter (OPT) family protein
MESICVLIYVFVLALNISLGIATGFTFMCILSTALITVALILSIAKIIINM